MISRAAVVGNRHSPELAAAAAALGLELDPRVAVDAAGTRAAISAAIGDGHRHVVVVGGDGMVHEAVQVLATTGVTLGIVPMGTGNDFARSLGLPIEDRAAAARCALDRGAPVDLIRTTHGWVASVATCGFSARVNERANRMRFPRGSSRYTVASLVLLARLRADQLTITFDDAPSERTPATLVAVANTTAFGGGMLICPDAVATDGLLDTAIIAPLGRFALLRFMPTVFTGKHRDNPRARFVRSSTVTIDGDVEVWGDGEPLGPCPVTLTAAPAALLVAGLGDPG